MPRATRYIVEGHLYHLTHRCADGEFFLRFTKERDAYREWLRIGVNRYHVSVLGYTVTSNHTHVVCEVRDRLAVGSEDFVDTAVKATTYRRHMDRYKIQDYSKDKAWAVCESSVSYNADSDQKLDL